MPLLFGRNSSTQYHLHAQLRGHSGAVARLEATADGTLLASAGGDGTRVWDLSTMREIKSPSSSAFRGATTALVWIKHEDDVNEPLFFGTQNGQLVCWKQVQQKGPITFEEISCVRVVEPAEITGLAFDAPSNRLAVCHRGGIIQVYTLGTTMSLTHVFTTELYKFVPRAVAFGKMTGNERDLMVFGLYGGTIYTLRGPDGDKVEGETWTVGAHIGDVALDVGKGVVCMDDPFSGTNLYRLDDHSRIKSFRISKKRGRGKRIRQVALLNECTSIVSGSDHGIVYIFDRRTADITDRLSINADDWVQAVTAVECAGTPTVFAAKSRENAGVNHIFVWRKNSGKSWSVGIASMGLACVGLIVLQVFVLVAAMSFMTQDVVSIIPAYKM
ncbi:WD40-repeat-containing domain protein [Roridomyces roridus]|uniref:WD40-repeat-containing domain protein n=1 Tax=Roridomyces roridus TaxID=1738132 RepID=A0AAD7FPP7_9AGAR|nr:WD40-repeat-containing domain protein [Roridomyces roridus]